MSWPIEDSLKNAARLLQSARHAVVFTGAGISTPSGIPDFRSMGTGLWERYDPMEVASLGAFQSHPERFYDWLRPILLGSTSAAPNPGHLALARLETNGVLKAIITQNIDNLHQRAGSKNIYEVHGSLRTMSCPRCHESYLAAQFIDLFQEKDFIPHCPQCKRVLKPDITLFGEMLPADVWKEAEWHCAQADVILVAGSSLQVWPAASLPDVAVEQGAHLIINNLSPTPLDSKADVLLPSNVAEILPQLASMIL